MELAQLESEALSLPTAQRALLADKLLQTLGVEDSSTMQKLADEADRRLDAYQRGEISSCDGPPALERIRREFGA